MYKMFWFIKKCFFIGSDRGISVNNQACKVRPEVINVNSYEPLFYPFSIKASKYSGSCENINDPYAKLCVPDIVKNLIVKVFNLMLRTNETRLVSKLRTIIHF